MTLPKHAALIVELSKDSPLIVEARRGPMTIGPKHTVIIGTSGSTDYLNDTTGNQRFWPVSVPRGEPALDNGQDCDGLHDEGAPVQYLCSRCFPDVASIRGDLTEPQDDEHDEARRDADEQME